MAEIIKHPNSGDLHIRKSSAFHIAVLLGAACFIGGLGAGAFYQIGAKVDDLKEELTEQLVASEDRQTERLENEVGEINRNYLAVQQQIFTESRTTRAYTASLQREMVRYGIEVPPVPELERK